MKLELKHLAPYLPYELIGIFTNAIDNSWKIQIDGLQKGNGDWVLQKERSYRLNGFKPILHPLSDLTKEIEHNGEKFVPRERLIEKYLQLPNRASQPEKYIDGCIAFLSDPKGYDRIPHWMYQDLIKWHFDVFGLIPEGLAININEI